MTTDLILLKDPNSPAAEAYRQLRLNLLSAGREAPLRTLLVAAAGPDRDKATIVANLAAAFAKIGKRTIVVDCDLRHPAQHQIFSLDNAAGVTTAVDERAGGLPLQDTDVPDLRLLASGPAATLPSDLIASPAMARLIERLAEQADIVLFDAPPVTLATDAAELATRLDGVLLTVAAGRTRRGDAQRAKEQLERIGARLVGAVLINAAAGAQSRNYLTPA